MKTLKYSSGIQINLTDDEYERLLKVKEEKNKREKVIQCVLKKSAEELYEGLNKTLTLTQCKALKRAYRKYHLERSNCRDDYVSPKTIEQYCKEEEK